MSSSILYPMLPSIITYEGPNGVKLVKWRIQPGHRLSKGTLMFISSNSGKEVKYKANAYGTTLELLVKEGDAIYNHDPIIKYLPCSHPTVMKDLCAECGLDLRELDDDEHKTSASVCMIHSVPELRVTQEQAEKLGKADETRLMKDGKLVLLVDLDQTLIHSTNEPPPDGLEDVYKYQLYGSNTPWYYTKLRPHTSSFLENISKFYELHICTFGARMYAHKIAELLDSSKKYFSHRILSRDECFDPTSKTGNLKALFPCGDSLVCIIDDRQDVWNFAPNLIAVKPYFFFKNTGDINSPYKPKEDSLFYNLQSGNLQTSPSTSSSPPNPVTETTTVVTTVVDKSKEDKIEKDAIAKIQDGNKDTDCKGDAVDVEKDKNIVINEGEVEESEGEPDTQEGESKIVNKPEEGSSTTESTSMVKARKEEEEEEEEEEEKVEKEEKLITETKEAETSPSTLKNAILKEKEDSELISETNEPIKEEEIKQFCETSHSNKIPLDKEKSATMEKEVGNLPENKPIDDPDDYLLYLEDILKRIHKSFFDCYRDLMKYSSDGEHIELPDLKKIIPQVRKKSLQGVNIVFSGLIPTNMPPEKSKLYSLARSLGANITKDIILVGSPLEKTTHVIAAKHGTAKVNKAFKFENIHIVNPLWLYCCAERWERVDEALFALKKDDNFDLIQEKKLKSLPSPRPESSAFNDDGSESSSRKVNIEYEEFPVYDPVTGKKVIKSRRKQLTSEASGSGMSSRPGSSRGRDYFHETDLQPSNMLQFSPLSGFSKNDLQLMDKEVDDACSEGDELSTGNTDSEGEDNQPLSGYKRRAEWESDEEAEGIGGGNEDDDDEEGEGTSYSEYPKGWNKRSKKCKYAFTRLADDDETRDSFAERSESSSNDDDYNESIGSVDEEMAAAVEREFLS